MNTNLPLILHLYEETPTFSANESLKTFFSFQSSPYTPKIDPFETLSAIILETKSFEKYHLESIQRLQTLGKNIILVVISEGDDHYLRSASLITRCVTFLPHTQSESLCDMILPMLREHIDTLRYMEALKLRSHRSGMVDSLNVVAHQWRQPINLISMEAINLSIQSTLEECVPSASIQKSTQMISEQSQRMAEILKNVLNMGKTHRGREPFSINAMLERVELFFTDQLQRERIEYLTIPLEEDKFLHGYASDLEEVLVNLIANAKDAFKNSSFDYQKSITIEAAYSPTEIFFHIKDNAGGIPESIRGKIFEPHFSTKGQGEGFGIGLHIARLIITQEFKGNLSFCVSDNETVFTLTVPRSDSSQLTFIYS